MINISVFAPDHSKSLKSLFCRVNLCLACSHKKTTLKDVFVTRYYLTDAGVDDHHGLDLVGKLVQEDGNAAVFVDAQRDLQRLFAIQKH